MAVKDVDMQMQVALLEEAAKRRLDIIRELANDNGTGTTLQVNENFGAIDAIRAVILRMELMTAQQFTSTVEIMAERLQNEEEIL